MSTLKGFFRKLADRAVWLLCPNRCPYCDKLIGYHDTECEECIKKLFNGVRSRELPEGGRCEAPFEYKGQVRQAILRYKFRSDISAAGSFAKQISKVTGRLAPIIDAVTNVPLSESSLKQRGYDQTELIARKTAEILEKPFCAALRKVRQKRVQHSLSLKERRENSKGCYAVSDAADIRGKTLLLIDDICTSGYTMAECRRVLLEAGARDVYCASAAISELDRQD